ncbi:OmcA/MtrC family decaheme c-type cytochrome [Shewanella eurypsychrophilus]|uniref:OmcA/MtrC family decaheme c-type cytochrome n=2 Tax=Shewanellaceae TaxID=267890 RepID=A0ABX6V5P4_9GAMM|nr:MULTISPECIES: OmcA/MtrC family decaheme c-type cytochrome [Shewanella]QFU25241.1 OmcA/MtrC family decaheme c-type cytochrome [Shewanella sp. YLB-09]QPG57302.1 OmcA/MtrC family decaheme c-type cytochrome [Shewanella eurypsychrophilus]
MKLITNIKSMLSKKSVSLMTLAALVAACGSDDGEPGNPGEPGGPPASDIASLIVEVDDVALNNGIATINYRVSNQDDEPVVGIPSSTYIAAQLLPQGFTNAGNSSQWQYFTSESCSSSCTGELVDHKNGKYSYTFSATFDGMNEMSYMSGATQRIVIKIGGDSLPDGTVLPTTNQHFDWQDSGEAAYTRNLIVMETCNTCHDDLAFHGSKYNEVETCVTCHSEGKVSSNDNIFPQMIHAKHLTGFPGSLADCQTCHVADETLTENMNWARVPGMEACGSCHTDINFPAGEGHPAQADNSNCVACHNSQWTMNVHNDGGDVEALAQFNAEIISASLSGTNVTFSIKLSNPTSGEVYADSADKLSFVDDLRIVANWGTSFDYATRSAKSIKLQDTPPVSGKEGTYTYEIAGLTIPVGSETDHGALAVQGKICSSDGELGDCSDESFSTVNIKSSHQFFNQSALSTEGRRVVVTNETCGSCHGDQALNFHGSRNDLEQQCQLCHNNNMMADASAANPSIATADFKHLIHGLHSSQREGYEDLTYPGQIGNCAQCHTNSDAGVLTAALPLNSAVQPLSLDDGTFTSATAAICSDCHSSASNHMIQQGAVFMGTEEDAIAGTESCATCHGQGATADVLAVHPIK